MEPFHILQVTLTREPVCRGYRWCIGYGTFHSYILGVCLQTGMRQCVPQDCWGWEKGASFIILQPHTNHKEAQEILDPPSHDILMQSVQNFRKHDFHALKIERLQVTEPWWYRYYQPLIVSENTDHSWRSAEVQVFSQDAAIPFLKNVDINICARRAQMQLEI